MVHIVYLILVLIRPSFLSFSPRSYLSPILILFSFSPHSQLPRPQIFTKRSMAADEPVGSLRVTGAALATWLQRQENSAFPILGPGPGHGHGQAAESAARGNMLVYGSFTPPPRPETALTPDLLAHSSAGGGGGGATRQSLDDEEEMTKYELAIFQAHNIPEKQHDKKEEKEKEEKRGAGGGMFSGFVQAFAGREKKEENHEVNRATYFMIHYIY